MHFVKMAEKGRSAQEKNKLFVLYEERKKVIAARRLSGVPLYNLVFMKLPVCEMLRHVV
jgi:hypothetical protein